jgi:hypothetical protein
MQQQGVTSVTIQGVASFNFKEASVTSLANNNDLLRFVPKYAYQIITADPANSTLPKIGSRLKWTVM